MPNYEQFQMGNSIYPLEDTLTNSLLDDADPGLSAALKFIRACLKLHIEDRFLAEAIGASYKQGDKANFNDFVPSSLHYDPTPYFTQSQYKFPLLAMYWTKTKEVNTRFSQAYFTKTREFNLLYIIPPFDVSQAFKLDPVFNAVENVIINRLKLRYEPNYADGYLVLDDAGIQDINIMSATRGDYIIRKAGSTQDVVYPSVLFEVEMVERQNYVEQPTLAGINITQSVADNDGEQIIIESAYDQT